MFRINMCGCERFICVCHVLLYRIYLSQFTSFYYLYRIIIIVQLPCWHQILDYPLDTNLLASFFFRIKFQNRASSHVQSFILHDPFLIIVGLYCILGTKKRNHQNVS